MLTGILEAYVAGSVVVGTGRVVWWVANKVGETLPHFREMYRRDCEQPQVDTANEIRVPYPDPHQHVSAPLPHHSNEVPVSLRTTTRPTTT